MKYVREVIVLSSPYVKSLEEVQERLGLEKTPQTVRYILRLYFKENGVGFNPPPKGPPRGRRRDKK